VGVEVAQRTSSHSQRIADSLPWSRLGQRVRSKQFQGGGSPQVIDCRKVTVEGYPADSRSQGHLAHDHRQWALLSTEFGGGRDDTSLRLALLVGARPKLIPTRVHETKRIAKP
jgi:hypothetical protein